MRIIKLFVLALTATALLISHALTRTVSSQSGPTEAPAAFDNQTNGFTTQTQFDQDRAAFEQREEIADGLGPVYNAQSCAECHQNPVSGGISQIFELRAGHIGPGNTFVAPPGGPLIQARATDARIQERVPDGSRIAFAGAADQLSVMGFDGGQYGPIGNTPVTGYFPSFSPDGTRLVFVRFVAGTEQIFVMNSDGTNLQQLTSGFSQTTPAWSPDGTKIAFSSTRTGLSQIFTMNPDGSGVTQLSNGLANDLAPAWSPDGTKIAFARTLVSLNARSDIWQFNANGSGQTQLTTTSTAHETRPAWSPDGTKIAFNTDRDGNWEIYRMTSTGAGQTRLTNNTATDFHPAWSPDGSTIAFVSNRSNPSVNTTAIWSMDTNGGSLTRLSAGAGSTPAYSKDEGELIRTFRSSLNLLGDGFVEATDDATFLAIRDAQPSDMRGTAISVIILESPGCDPQVPSTCEQRLGRFGWKNSVASLLTFSAGAYRLEQGITSPLQPTEDTSLGRNVSPFDLVAGLEDTGGPQGFGEDVEAFTRFMRATKAPPRDRDLVPDDATDPGSQLFDQLSCAVCHTRSITTTANAGMTFNGGTFTVGSALANKTYHPFGDFLLHDIGTGDGIVEAGGELTRNMVRTAPLWGLRTRDRLMHDGGSSSPPTNGGTQSFTLTEAIMRHGVQAAPSRAAFIALTPVQKAQLFKFLKSL